MTENRQTVVSPHLHGILTRGLASIRTLAAEVIEAEVRDTANESQAIERIAGAAGALAMHAIETDRADRLVEVDKREADKRADLRDAFAARAGHPPEWYAPTSSEVQRLSSWPYWYAYHVMAFRNQEVEPAIALGAAGGVDPVDPIRTRASAIAPVAEALGAFELRPVAPERVGPVDPVGTDPLVECLACGERAPQSLMEKDGVATCRHCGSRRVRVARVLERDGGAL